MENHDPRPLTRPSPRAATRVDEALIRECYSLASSAVENGDHPFGAMLVVGGKVVMKAENTVRTQSDPTRHAELNLIRQISANLGRQTFAGSTLYSSTEPCIMCAGAIYWAGVRRIVYGVSARALELLTDAKFVIPTREIYSRLEPRVEVVGPVLEAEGMATHARYWPKILQ